MITGVLRKLLYMPVTRIAYHSAIGPVDSVECNSMVSLTAMIPLQQHFHKTLFIYRFIYLFTFYCLFMRYVFLPLFSMV